MTIPKPKLGRKPKFAEKSKIYSARLPLSKYKEIKKELDKIIGAHTHR